MAAAALALGTIGCGGKDDPESGKLDPKKAAALLQTEMDKAILDAGYADELDELHAAVTVTGVKCREQTESRATCAVALEINDEGSSKSTFNTEVDWLDGDIFWDDTAALQTELERIAPDQDGF